MLDMFRQRMGARVAHQVSAGILLLIVLPLAAPAMAESALQGGAEKETTAKESIECLACGNEDRPPQQRSVPASKPINLTRHHAACCGSQRLGYTKAHGHRLQNDLCAPLRC